MIFLHFSKAARTKAPPFPSIFWRDRSHWILSYKGSKLGGLKMSDLNPLNNSAQVPLTYTFITYKTNKIYAHLFICFLKNCANKLFWIRLTQFVYPHTKLYIEKWIVWVRMKESICECKSDCLNTQCHNFKQGRYCDAKCKEISKNGQIIGRQLKHLITLK